MFLMVLMGALVTNTGSGKGCGGSWPLCKGSFMPDLDYKAIIEYSHRGVSGLGGFLTLVLAVVIWRAFPKRPLLRWLGATALGTVILQGALGALAALYPQPKAVLALHMGISLICFSSVLLVTTLLARNEDRPASLEAAAPLFRRWVWTVAVYAYVVIYLGAYVRHMKAAPACLGWPLCNGEVVPALYGLTGINFIHRLAAGLLAIMVIRLALLARRWAPGRKDLQTGAWLAVLLVLAQVGAGAFFGLGYINLATQELHTGLIALFWGAISYLVLQALPAPQAAVRQAPTDTRPNLAH
jgi:cytochrome c oxidase assembly protein subunit 15